MYRSSAAALTATAICLAALTAFPALASDATAAMWGETYDTRVMQKYMRAMAAQQHALLDKTYGALDPDLPEFMTEAADLAALVYDTAGTVEIGADRVDARFDLNLL